MDDYRQHITRRRLLGLWGAGAAAALWPNMGCSRPGSQFLGNARQGGADDPRLARLEWFKQADFGLFMHYGLYSLLGRSEAVMFRERIPVAEYARLKDRFTAENFDADFITDLALEAGMQYVNLTSRHCDGFCLFRTDQTDYNSVDSPARRDLVGELADACQRKGLGLFLYYAYAADWYHPYFFNRTKRCRLARPDYAETQPRYLYRKESDFRHYIDYAHAQLVELLTQYSPLAGIWLDPLVGYWCRPEMYPIHETYTLIRQTQPGCLISFKQGACGDEDFVAPERKVQPFEWAGQDGLRVWEKNRGKPAEICDTLQPSRWGYNKSADGQHKSPGQVMNMLADARRQHANLLLNTGPLPDGSIHPEDVATLQTVGKRRKMSNKNTF